MEGFRDVHDAVGIHEERSFSESLRRPSKLGEDKDPIFVDMGGEGARYGVRCSLRAVERSAMLPDPQTFPSMIWSQRFALTDN